MQAAQQDASSAAITRAAGANLHPEPEFIRHASDELGYAWARIAWQRAASTPGAWFDAGKADKVVELWPTIFTLTDDRFAGKPFRLTFWQEVIVRLLIGWKVPVDITDPESGKPTTVFVRLYRQLRLWIPRKNGKSEFLAALSLLFWALEGVPRGQGFCFAADEEQARVVFDKMSDMVGYAPDSLKKAVRVLNKALWIQSRKSAFRLLAGKAGGKHGRGPVVITGDEMHEWKSRALMTTLRQGTGTRLQPIELYASTAGPRNAAVGLELYQESKKILDGTIEDPTTLVVIFELGEDEDPFDEANWPKANPSLGLSPTVAFLRREAAYAKESPRAEAEFRCFHLGQWVDAMVRWLKAAHWKACSSDPLAWKRRLEDPHGEGLAARPCFVTIDASATQDITGVMLTFPPLEEDGDFIAVPRFFVPEAQIRERSKARIDYDKWHAAGALEATEGDAVDQDAVRRAVHWALETFDVLKIGRDPWNTIKLVTDLQKDGVDPDLFVDMRQGIQSLGEPSRLFERLVVEHRYDHGSHPVLGWMAGHCQVRFDENLNFMPARKRSADKIDGIVAGVMGVGLWMAPGEQEPNVRAMVG